jgi:hypothetical protein
MAGLLAVCKWLEQSAVGASVRQSLWLFPAIETAHLLGMAALLAAVGAFDLRLIGVVLRNQSLTCLSSRLLPWAWAAFVVQVITGGLLFSSEAARMVVNPAFRLKMVLILLAGMHAFAFHFVSRRNLTAWSSPTPPVAARVAGSVSLLLWIGVVAAGRWIGFI